MSSINELLNTIQTSIYGNQMRAAIHDAIQLISQSLDGKAQAIHIHSVSEVSGLSALLAQKAALVHSHAISDIIGLSDAIDSKADSVQLENKSDVGHTHQISSITGLISALASKAEINHTHAYETITGLVEALNGKAAEDHYHTSDEILDLSEKLSEKANALHNHAMSDVTGLIAALAGKSNTNHTHTFAEVKPQYGITKNDLDAGVRSSLNKADTALQYHQDISGKENTWNKTSSISQNSTNIQYPGAKAVYDFVMSIANFTPEEWTFTLDDNTTITKKVLIWNP